jgi:hypothetical membrane protein
MRQGRSRIVDVHAEIQASAARPANRLLLAAGVVGPALFVIVALVEGATRPDYSAWREFVSLLSLSDQGWEQIANFIVCGLLVFAFALGLPRALGRGRGAIVGAALLGAFGLLLVVAGVFVTDPSQSYPPGATLDRGHTPHGVIHALTGLFVFVTLSLAAFVLARRFAGDPAWRGWTAYSIATGAVALAAFIASVRLSALDDQGSCRAHPPGHSSVSPSSSGGVGSLLLPGGCCASPPPSAAPGCLVRWQASWSARNSR